MTTTNPQSTALSYSPEVNVDGWCDCICETPWFPCAGCGEEVNLLKIGASAVHWQKQHWHIHCAFQSLYARISPASTAPVVDNLLSRLINELEQAVTQGYQPNLLDVAEAKRLLTTKPLAAMNEAAQSVAGEILDFLNFDCENDEVKQDISGAAYIISKFFPSAAATAAPVEPRVKWDRSGLKEACQRALRLGRTHQETDIQLFLDMLLEIERLEEAR